MRQRLIPRLVGKKNVSTKTAFPCPTLDPQPVDVSQPLTSGLALFKLVALIACKIKPEENLWQRIK
jgi:hypothetical protein